MITVTQKDALRSEAIKAGWKIGECVGHTPDTSAKDGSAFHRFEIEVEENGVKIPLQDFIVSEKAVSMGKAFFIACGFPKEEWDKLVRGEETSAQIDEKECVGKKFKVHVSNEKFENRVLNKATDFLPL